jgi:hypothetical protein
MRTDAELRDALRSWILGKASDLDDGTLDDRTPLFEQRHLRSVHLPELLLLLESMRGAPIDVDDLTPGDFRDVATLVARFGTGGSARSTG